MKKYTLFFLCFLLMSGSVLINAQTINNNKTLSAIADEVLYNHSYNTPNYILLKAGQEFDLMYFDEWMKNTLNLPSETNFKIKIIEKDKLGQVHYRYQQMIGNIPVLDAVYIAHTKGGKVISLNGEKLMGISERINSTPAITEKAALAKALSFFNAKTYMWQVKSEENFLKATENNPGATYYPKGKLVFLTSDGKNSTGNYKLAYEFCIYSYEPYRKENVYVDAISGKVLFSRELINTADAPGTAVTKYSGNQTITADSYSGSYRLREVGRGNGIQTWNALKGTSTASSVDFTDTDNNWNNVNANKDEAATDAHLASEKMYDYLLATYGRNSLDDNGFILKNYVHWNNNWLNASWNGSQMSYGDGSASNGYNPLTTLDIGGHEVTHGLTSFTAGLIYQDESGALSEGYSDIFGTTLEFYVKPSVANWTIGEDCQFLLRSLSDPKQEGLPDTYLGVNWYGLTGDNGGVHTNCGPLAYWYYLVCQGGSGINDNSDSYNITGIGMTKAAAIAYRTLTIYLTQNSGYADARTYSIISAEDLYGTNCAPEVITVTNAFYAIGVGGLFANQAVSNYTLDKIYSCTVP
ncbi:MAG: M4 family metallopeptidase, partial [Bacteroidales bacterium]|nr:M4 family metallopeptidase [Bacteroidales bacterium]